jgi:hypothetical protein
MAVAWHDNKDKGWRSLGTGGRVESVARNLYTAANLTIAKRIVASMDAEEILQRLGGIDSMPEELKVQVLISYPALHKHIDTNTLNADNRVILLCLNPTKVRIRKFDFNANDLLMRHYDYLLAYGHRSLVNALCENINDEKLALFKTGDWSVLLHYCPTLAPRFNLREAKNLSDLRYLILKHPSLLNHVTVEDMQNCLIDGPTWIRIITQMIQKDRCWVPKGFTAWVARDVFKQKLTGRRFKPFKADWTNGLQE